MMPRIVLEFSDEQVARDFTDEMEDVETRDGYVLTKALQSATVVPQEEIARGCGEGWACFVACP